ncbi:MAG: division/cell wall cluster transcriptional repressor MraZ [Clostridia bacterium]|nr:division/cell wall cluster transcriptional repressor MraZ [Clostridia bacterium]
MRGEYQHNIDAKGRLIFPINLRKELGDKFVVFKGLDNCLWVYSVPDWEEFERKIAALPTKARKLQRFYSANFECEPDSQGRILIPQSLRAYAGLQKDVVVVGIQNRAEIWDSKAWDEYNGDLTSDDIAELMEAMDV